MLALLSSTAAQFIGGITTIGAAVVGLIWFGHRWGVSSTKANAAAQDEATQAAVIARQQAMANAAANSPADVSAEVDRLNKGTF